MFTLKTLLILSVIALSLYCIKATFQMLLYSTGLRAGSLLKKWTDRVSSGEPGHIDANVKFGPGEQPS
jgi:ABC-type protease/lipase transport system fused ATPase/permease subunit